MTRVWIVRHASTDWTGRRFCGRTDVPLSARGVEEAVALGARLATGLPADLRVVTSPAIRARETAELIVASLATSVPIDADPRLGEVDFGEAEGLTFDDIGAAMPGVAAQIMTGRPVDWPGGESSDSVRERARAAWHDIAAGSIPSLVVTHGGFIRAVLDRAVGPHALDGRRVEPAEAIELARRGGRWHIVTSLATASGAA
jgi:broad specificity phosphatase PhoE